MLHDNTIINVLCEKIEALESQVSNYDNIIEEFLQINMPTNGTEQRLFDVAKSVFESYHLHTMTRHRINLPSAEKPKAAE